MATWVKYKKALVFCEGSKEDYTDLYMRDGKFPGHGTPVAWLIHSIAPSADLISYQVCDKSGTCNPRSVLAALLDAVMYARGHGYIDEKNNLNLIVNISLGRICQEVMLQRAINDLNASGLLVVASAGSYARGQSFTPNQRLCLRSPSTPVQQLVVYPAVLGSDIFGKAASPNIISVGSIKLALQSNINNSRLVFSPEWQKDIQGVVEQSIVAWAPGKQVLSFGSQPHDKSYLWWFSGTSFAAAQITGLAAVERAQMQNTPNPAERIKSCLKELTNQGNDYFVFTEGENKSTNCIVLRKPNR